MTTQSFDLFALSLTDAPKNITKMKFEADQYDRALRSALEDKDDDMLSGISIRISERVACMLARCYRFESLATELRQEPDCMDLKSAAAILASSDSQPMEVKRALVFLALKASAESGRIMDFYTPPVNLACLHEFHSVARIEWEKRVTDRF